MEDVDGFNILCFVGCFIRDYSDMFVCDCEDLFFYYGIGIGLVIMFNCIFWFFNMKGFSISFDIVCLLFMVVLYFGCQSI